MNIVAFDIETVGGHFEASYGRLLCLCWGRPNESAIHTVHSPTLKSEKAACREVVKMWRDADVVVSWNGKLFDFPFLVSRVFMQLGEKLDKRKHLDLYWIARSNFKLRGYRLENFAKDVNMKERKFEVPASDWVKAMESAEYPAAYNRIVRHCEQDVRMTLEALDLLRPFIKRITE